jgi:hypothetical protein
MDKKYQNFLEVLGPKNALIIGLVSGILLISTIGFIVLGSMALNGGVNCSANIDTDRLATDNAQQPLTEAPKTDKPKVELFVMSYCPFGLQMEKAYLPVMELLGKKADIDIKFVNYAMHEKKEVDENTRQYCIQKEQTEKYTNYLKCFASTDKFDTCLAGAQIDEYKLTACITKADKEFKISKSYDDKANWLGGQFPAYLIHQDLNVKYGVQGSPTLVINGVQAEADRTPEAVKTAICNAFNQKPAECSTTLSNQGFQPGFGTEVEAAGPTAASTDSCN